MTWSPEQYERFRDERAQPFHDLVALIEHRPHMRVVDLGCGTGELTRQLHDHLNAEETVGIDSSETMLLKSSAFGGAMLRFEQSDIEGFVTDRPYDLVFSNAALHWVPNHESLFRRLTGFLARDGQLAIQVPANHDHVSQTIAGDVAEELGFARRVSPVLPVEQYAALLHALGFRRQHARLQVYPHVLESAEAVVEWMKGSTLTEYQRRLGNRYDEFLARYRDRLTAALGDHRPCFFPFKRILLWATF